MSLADTYATITAQSLDELGRKTKNPKIAIWALRYKIATANAVFTDAASPNPLVCLLDMVVFASLKRAGLEEHWVPTLLGDEGKPVLAGFRRAEDEAWALAKRALSPAQVIELRELIGQWQKDNPTQYYVSHVRFTDFSDYRHMLDGSGKAQKPGSIFGVLFVDPLVDLDPVTREVRSYRVLTERVLFVAMRMPMIFSWEAQAAIMEAADNPEIQRLQTSVTTFNTSLQTFNDSVKTFNDTWASLAKTMGQYPHDLGKEREAMVKQFLDGMTVQRKALFEDVTTQRQALFEGMTLQRQGILKELEAEHDRLSALIVEARRTLADIRETSGAVSASANNTVAQAEQSSSRLASRIFTYLLILLLVLLIVGPLMLLVYRYAASRLPVSRSEPRHAPVAPLQTR